MTKAEDIMTRRLIVVDEGFTLQTIERMMKNHNINHMLVAENMQLKGVISDGDIYRLKHPKADGPLASKSGEMTLHTPASQIMSRHVQTVKAETPVVEIVDIFLQGKYHCLPVVEGNRQLVGVITSTDILMHCRRFF